MAERQAIPTNTPGWFDLGTSDPEASRTYYSQLFGWTADVIPDPQAGGYGFFNLDGKMVGGVGPLQDASQPTAWTTYIMVSDTAATVAKARESGGTVYVEPVDVMGQGIMAVLADPTGAAFGIWQPAEHQGVQVQGTPGSAGWSELHSSDVGATKPFYQGLFGWEAGDTDMGGWSYTEFKVGGRSIAGATGPPPGQEAGPAYWLLYFAVEDVDASTERATELGGTVLAPAMDFPGGRFSVVRDPQGAAFGLLRTTS